MDMRFERIRKFINREELLEEQEIIEKSKTEQSNNILGPSGSIHYVSTVSDAVNAAALQNPLLRPLGPNPSGSINRSENTIIYLPNRNNHRDITFSSHDTRSKNGVLGDSRSEIEI